jgi:REP element-mobilizing transposase RayT
VNLSPLPPARPAPEFYRRNLPHFQGDGSPLFVTFRALPGIVLPASARGKVLAHCLHDHGRKIELHCAVVMPDHVHLIYRPLDDGRGGFYGLEEVVGSLKGASAHSVNRLLQRRGSVWQDEPFDHVLRAEEQGWAKIEYIVLNPVRKGLCAEPCEYPWLWVDPDLASLRNPPLSIIAVLRRRLTAGGGCATSE